MVRCLYWCHTLETNEKFNFMSEAVLDIGMEFENEDGTHARIDDMAVETFPISCEDLAIERSIYA